MYFATTNMTEHTTISIRICIRDNPTSEECDITESIVDELVYEIKQHVDPSSINNAYPFIEVEVFYYKNVIEVEITNKELR